MEYITDFDSFRSSMQTAVTLGKFDGLHRGHQRLVEKLKEYVSPQCGSLLCAFDMQKETLMTKEERFNFLRGKIDYLVDCPFTEELRRMEAEEFIRRILCEKFRSAHVVVGEDFTFGHDRAGDYHLIEKYSKEMGYTLDVVEKEQHNGREISSTYIKEALAIGNVELANHLLGYQYEITGIVERGRQLGRTLGFPTMNIVPKEGKILPRHGVYACTVLVGRKWYPAVGNAGIKPTVSDERRKLLELYVYGYQGDAYGEEITARFCQFERPETKFGSVEELQRQVMMDMRFGEEYFQEHPVNQP